MACLKCFVVTGQCFDIFILVEYIQVDLISLTTAEMQGLVIKTI
jgi:hypothetical protein